MLLDIIDIDECSTRSHNCSINRVCANTNGSFLCQCGNGYSGNETACYGKAAFFNVFVNRILIPCKCGCEFNKRGEVKTYNGHTGATRSGGRAGGVRLAKPT